MNIEQLFYKMQVIDNNYKKALKNNENKGNIIHILYKHLYLINDINTSNLFLDYLKKADKKNDIYIHIRGILNEILQNYDELTLYNKNRKLEDLNTFNEFFIKALKII